MAEIIVYEGESIERAVKRFARAVAQEGTLSTLRRRSYFQSPTQKRRAKSKLAQKRLRRFLRRNKPKDMPDDKREGWIFLAGDIASGWPIDLNAKPPKNFVPNSRTQQPDEPTVAEEPTDNSCIIFRYYDSAGNSGIILVQNEPDPGERLGRYGFPGGKVEDGETPQFAAIREAFEETGYTVDLVPGFYYKIPSGNHMKHFFAGVVISGSPKKGTEIRNLICKTDDEMAEMIQAGLIKSYHLNAYRAFREREEASK